MAGGSGLNFRDYSTAARYAAEINAGYTANLFGLKECPYRDGADLSNRSAAWHHGFQQAQRHIKGHLM